MRRIHVSCKHKPLKVLPRVEQNWGSLRDDGDLQDSEEGEEYCNDSEEDDETVTNESNIEKLLVEHDEDELLIPDTFCCQVCKKLFTKKST